MSDPIRYFNRGRLHLRFERPAEAMQDFQRCLELQQQLGQAFHPGAEAELRNLKTEKRVYAKYTPGSRNFKLATIVREDPIRESCVLQFDGYRDTATIPNGQIKRITQCGRLRTPASALAALVAQPPPAFKYCCKCSGSFNSGDGVLCNSTIPEKHFTCKTCFATHVVDECDKFEKITRYHGKIYCYGCYASAGKQARPFEHHDVCKHVNAEVFQHYLDATRKFEIAEMERVTKQTEALKKEALKAEHLEAAKRKAEEAEKRAKEQATKATREAEAQRQRAVRQAAEDRRVSEQARKAVLAAQAEADRAKVEEAAAREALEKSEGQPAVPAYWHNKRSDARVAIIDDSRHMNSIVQQAMVASIAAACNAFACSGCGVLNARVTAVHRVENMNLWRNYQNFRRSLQDRLRENVTAIEQLQPRVAHMLSADRILDASINEFLLFHGTTHETANMIANTGFDERQSRLQGLYGAGTYFADAMCKASQYARESNAQGEYCMLYCRVAMGASFCTHGRHINERRPPANPSDPRGVGIPFDSIFAESGVARQGEQLHNEFVCFRDYQIYPEYIVYFKR